MAIATHSTDSETAQRMGGSRSAQITARFIFGVAWLAAIIFACGCAQPRTEVVGDTDPIPPPGAEPIVGDPLTETQMVQIANQEAERRKIPIREFKGPFVHHASGNKWFVSYYRGRFPGDHFSIEIDAGTGATRFRGGS